MVCRKPGAVQTVRKVLLIDTYGWQVQLHILQEQDHPITSNKLSKKDNNNNNRISYMVLLFINRTQNHGAHNTTLKLIVSSEMLYKTVYCAFHWCQVSVFILRCPSTPAANHGQNAQPALIFNLGGRRDRCIPIPIVFARN